MALTRIPLGKNPAASDDINQVIDALTGNTGGVAGGNSPISLTAVNDAVAYALAIKNNDSGAKGLVVYDAASNGLFEVTATGVKASPDGLAAPTAVLVLGGAQTLTGLKTFSGGIAVSGGNVGIGGAPAGNSGLYFSGTINAASGAAAGVNNQPTLVAQANNDTLYAYVSNAVYNLNSKTGVNVAGHSVIAPTVAGAANSYGLTVSAPSGATGDNIGLLLGGGAPALKIAAGGLQIAAGSLQVPQPQGSQTFALDANGTGQSLVNNGTMTPIGGANNFSGLLIVTDINTPNTAIFLVGSSTVVLVSQTGSNFSSVATTAAKTNVYANAGVVTIENKTGGTVEYRVMALRTRNSI
jgi:hypothetical protein